MKNKLSINLEVSIIEIIMSVLIFAIAGAIMLNCFVLARFTQTKANDKVSAGNIIQSNVEMIKSFKNTAEMTGYLNENFEILKTNDNEIIYINYYNEDWVVSTQNKEYFITITIANSKEFNGLKDVHISAEKVNPYPFIDKTKKNKSIYEIETKKFFPI